MSREQQAAKKAEQARKKAEREAALADEEKSLPTRAAPKNSKTAVKKTNRGLDQALSELSVSDENKKLATIETSGIDNILEALGAALTENSDVKVDRHATRRVKAAYTAFEERRLKEMSEDGSGQGLRLSQKKERIHDEFKKSPENPHNNTLNVEHNATKDDIAQTKAQDKARVETLYSSK